MDQPEIVLDVPPPDFTPPDHSPSPSDDDGWRPRLNPTQQKVFDDIAKFILAYGEKGTGKSIGCLHALVRHCYEEEDALALIIAPAIRTGKEGVMYDLEWVLDIWKNGNLDPKDPDKKRRLDDGIEGFEFTEPSLDPQTKDRCIHISNRHGGWSKVILMSIPYEEVVEKRMKSLSPSFVYVDEITELGTKSDETKVFFTYIAQQLGRRRGIRGPQQYVASCNPEGPTHWVYKVWWEDAVDKETGKRHTSYSTYHVPIQENYDNLPPGYIEGLKELYKDPIDIERLLKGRWIDRPSGEAIFKLYFLPEIHVRGSAKERTGLAPNPGIPIIISYDPGPVNYCISFEQMVPTKEKVIWKVFDELNYVDQFMPDTLVVKRLLDRMDHWNTRMKGGASFIHVADQSAFTHKRHDGSYDATRLVQLSNGRIRPRACPQARESVVSRVQMVITMLLSETLFISAACPRTVEMLRLLASEKAKPGKYDASAGLKPKRSPYIHPFDAMSYGPFYFTMNPAIFALQMEERMEPQVYGAKAS